MPFNPRHLIAALIIAAVTLLVYRNVLFLPNETVRYPWSSDAWGHLIKAEYLDDEIRQGNIYPDLFPQWYNGQQMLRYYAPLPYYGLVGLMRSTSDTFKAGNWFLFIAALVGGLSMLLYSPRFGLEFATIGGVLFVLLPDNIRVAFAEGNIPRVMATALLPATVYFAISLLTQHNHRKLYFVGLAATISLIVLTHAMMAAIFGACIILLAAVYWLISWRQPRYAIQTVLAVVTGVLLSAWWLLPSLTGGITELNTEAATVGLAQIPWNTSLNPTSRMHNIEAFYVGISLLLVIALGAVYWRRMDGLVKALFVVSFVTMLISTTLVNDIYNTLPLHQLFWPLRFMSFSGFIAVLAAMALLSAIWRSASGKLRPGQFAVVAIIAIMVLDFWPSTRLLEVRHQPPEITRVSNLLRDSTGWRVAAADLSQLGSAPSYLFSTLGGREQVFGWAFQGAITAPLLGMLNQAIEKGYGAFAVDRLELLGTDDIVIVKNKPGMAYKISPEFVDALPLAGYGLTYDGDRLMYFHKDGKPRVYALSTEVFGIGSGGRNLALLFPQIVSSGETAIDSHSMEFLANFDTLILSGFTWNDKREAERMVRELADDGVRVIIDLTGTPLDPVARVPHFMGVYGERVLVHNFSRLKLNGIDSRLQPFDDAYSPWYAYVPQGVDSKEITFNILDMEGVIIGHKDTDNGKVAFLGLNLMFHSVLTGDETAIGILEGVTGLTANLPVGRSSITAEAYRATDEGYGFRLNVPADGYYLIPVAHHSGTMVYVDGRETESISVESLTVAKLTEGSHEIEIRSERTAIYSVGLAFSGIGLALVLGTLFADVFVFRKTGRSSIAAPRKRVLGAY